MLNGKTTATEEGQEGFTEQSSKQMRAPAMDESQGVPRSSNSGVENIGLVEVLYKVDGG